MATAFPNLIDGRSVDSTERTPDINPSNVHDIVGEFARGTPADVERADRVGASRRSRSGRGRTPQERFDILDRAGTEILARKEELGRLLSREQGKPLADGIGEAGRAGAIFKFFAGEAVRIRGDKLDSVRPGHRSRGHARAGRRRRGDHALEFSARDSGVEDRAGARIRELRRLQARGARAGVAVDARRHRAARRAAGRRAQSGDGARLEDRSRDRVVAGRRRGELHGLAGRRRRYRRRRGQERRARAARDGRQESAHRARRRRPGDGGVGRGQRRVLPDRTALHGVEPHDRHRRHSRSFHRRDDRAHEEAGRRRCAEAGDGDRSGRRREAAGQEPRVRGDRPEGRRAGSPTAASA